MKPFTRLYCMHKQKAPPTSQDLLQEWAWNDSEMYSLIFIPIMGSIPYSRLLCLAIFYSGILEQAIASFWAVIWTHTCSPGKHLFICQVFVLQEREQKDCKCTCYTVHHIGFSGSTCVYAINAHILHKHYQRQQNSLQIMQLHYGRVDMSQR